MLFNCSECHAYICPDCRKCHSYRICPVSVEPCIYAINHGILWPKGSGNMLPDFASFNIDQVGKLPEWKNFAVKVSYSTLTCKLNEFHFSIHCLPTPYILILVANEFKLHCPDCIEVYSFTVTSDVNARTLASVELSIKSLRKKLLQSFRKLEDVANFGSDGMWHAYGLILSAHEDEILHVLRIHSSGNMLPLGLTSKVAHFYTKTMMNLREDNNKMLLIGDIRNAFATTILEHDEMFIDFFKAEMKGDD